MHEILADLVAEQQALDQYLQTLREREWKTPTPPGGWDVRDQVSHLASTDDFAYSALEGDKARFRDIGDGDVDAFNQIGVESGRNLRPQEVIEWWRATRARMVDSLSRKDPSERIAWLVGSMSAKSFATARLTETWAHGLDVHHAFDDEPKDTPRLRHVAWLGWKTLQYAFEKAGEEYSEPIRLELVGPNFERWVIGPDDTAQVVRGAAGEWCRVAVRRLAGDDTSLKTEGEVAATALSVARTYV